MKRVSALMLWVVLLIIALVVPVSHAQARKGKVTDLPIPRYVSLKKSEGNVRRGPSLNHRIDWVFKQQGMPLRVTAEHGHWRRVEDRDGEGGWVHYSLLSGTRTVIVENETITLFSRPRVDAIPVAQLEANVVAKLGECNAQWCYLSVKGYAGWTPKLRLWGVELSELRD